jgi:CRP/FNR family transcriptional regulator
LNEWAEREGKIEGNEVYLMNYLTQTDIANLICTSRQTATQLIHELETAGLLQYHRKFITIFDKSKLQ